MVDLNPIKISRKWFIQAKNYPIENDYSFKADRDVSLLFLFDVLDAWKWNVWSSVQSNS